MNFARYHQQAHEVVAAEWRNLAIEEFPHCDYCDTPVSNFGDTKATADHIVPLKYAKGAGRGTIKYIQSVKNLALACERCNRQKGNWLLSECGMKLLRKRNAMGQPITLGGAIDPRSKTERNRIASKFG